jgi:Ca2+-binding RTX toxin-like protein
VSRTAAAVAALLSLSGLGVASSSVAAATAPTCLGATATIVGTPGDDLIIGTPGHDVVVGRGGNDRIYGRDGADAVCGGAGDDVIHSGPMNDVAFGGSGDDQINTGPGDFEYALGQRGDDVLALGTGSGRLDGGPGADTMTGRAGAISVRDTGGRSTVRLGNGDDSVWVEGPDSVVSTGAGDDEATSLGAGGRLSTGPGADTVSGASGVVESGPGEDLVWPSPCETCVDGDTLDVRTGDGNDILLLEYDLFGVANLDGGRSLGDLLWFYDDRTSTVDVDLSFDVGMTKPYTAAMHGWEILKGTGGRNDIVGSDRPDDIQTYGPGAISMLGGDDHYEGWADAVDGGDGYDVCLAVATFVSCEFNPTVPPAPAPAMSTTQRDRLVDLAHLLGRRAPR